MKSIVLFLLLLGELSGGRLAAQGSVVFANVTSTAGWAPPADRNVYWDASAANYNPLLTAGGLVTSNYAGLDLSSLRAALYFAQPDITNLSGFTLALGSVTTFRSTTSAYAGSWFTRSVTLDGIPAGGYLCNMIVVVWDSNLSLDPLSSAARTGLWGQSAMFQFATPGIAGPTSVYLPHDLRAFTVGVPEPASAAIGAIGLFVFCFSRGRGGVGPSAKGAWL